MRLVETIRTMCMGAALLLPGVVMAQPPVPPGGQPQPGRGPAGGRGLRAVPKPGVCPNKR